MITTRRTKKIIHQAHMFGLGDVCVFEYVTIGFYYWICTSGSGMLWYLPNNDRAATPETSKPFQHQETARLLAVT